jgi:predicted acetyltransferase
MNFRLEKVKIEEKQVLFNLLQFALYDGSQYIKNELNNFGLFNYEWFDNYFTDDDRYCFFIKDTKDTLLGFVMVNKHMKVYESGHSIAEFLILPNYRGNQIGKKVAFQIFDIFKGNWEVEPIENSDGAYNFWKKTIEEYTNNNYKYEKNIFLFEN